MRILTKMTISRKGKELSEIRWWEDDQIFRAVPDFSLGAPKLLENNIENNIKSINVKWWMVRAN